MDIIDRKYVRTWCDYLTPCPHFNNNHIGDYYCSKCRYFVSSSEDSTRFLNLQSDVSSHDYYKHYSTLINGVVKCSKL